MHVFPRKFSRTIARERRYQIITTLPAGERDNQPPPRAGRPERRQWPASSGESGPHLRRPLVGYESGADLAAARRVSLKTVGCLCAWRRAVYGTR
jgi:hypothetical protein